MRLTAKRLGLGLNVPVGAVAFLCCLTPIAWAQSSPPGEAAQTTESKSTPTVASAPSPESKSTVASPSSYVKPSSDDETHATTKSSLAPASTGAPTPSGVSGTGTSMTSGYRRPYVNPSLGGSEPLGRGLSVGMMLGVYVGINVVAYLAWWQGSPPDQFEWIKDGWFGDRTYAGGADKLGHFYACHLQTRAIAGILEEGGWPARTSTYAGAALTMGTFYVIEMRDAFSTGFSVNDMISNVVGTATGVLFREFPLLDELFDTRVEYIPSAGYAKKFHKTGFNFSEDYTGMTYLLAWHLSSVPAIERLPGPLRFIDLVLGYNARNYRPKVTDPHVPKYQDRFIGFSLNLQRVIDELWMGRHPDIRKSTSRTHRFAHFATEFLNVPYTSVAVGTWRNEYRRE